MSDLVELLRLVGKHLDGRGVSWALVGGWAVSIRTEPRFTRDVDVAVTVRSDADAESLVETLTSQGFRVDAIVEQEAVQRLATVRLRPPPSYESGLLLDVLFASSGIEREVCTEADRLECLPDFVAPVARIEHLLALKILARDDRNRPQDASDIRNLLLASTDVAIGRTRELLNLITERGFNRQRNLLAALDGALLEFPRRDQHDT